MIVKKKKFKKRIFLYILELFFLALFIYSSYMIIDYLINSKKNDDLIKDLSKSVEIKDDTEVPLTLKEKYNIDFKTLKEQNSDTIAWLKVYGTDIEYPVVKTTNNYYYLGRNFDKTPNNFGWIFANYVNKFDGADKNITIFGHAMLNGTMFGTLKKVLTEDWRSKEENLKIVLVTESDANLYEVFSTYKVEDEYYFFKDKFQGNEFSEFIETVKNRSEYNFNVDVNSEDQILTLATCDNNNHSYRIVLHAKKI